MHRVSVLAATVVTRHRLMDQRTGPESVLLLAPLQATVVHHVVSISVLYQTVSDPDSIHVVLEGVDSN